MPNNYAVVTGAKGEKEVAFLNTAIDRPTLRDLNEAAKREFPDVPEDKIYPMAGIMRLTLKENPSIL